MEKSKTIELLTKDMEDEHGAIIQYLGHAYAIGEGEVACEIEAIAREEMRHLDWLAEAITALGGELSFKRGMMDMTGKTVSEWMQANVGLENGAITQYREHIKLIDDPKIKRLLERILSDEESHQGDFKHFVEKTLREKMVDRRGDTSNITTENLSWGIKHEYTVIIQYLLQSYSAKNEETRKELQDQAINEMQHMGWLSEKMIDKKGHPHLEHDKFEKTRDHTKMLKTDIELEHKVADKYDQSAAQTNESDVKELFQKLATHERYHAEIFKDLLE
ncbi:MAG: bacterioferritin [Dehalococcoides mccartyi]|uniref:ferritin-like domain-containing protein n=1 Tax=Dehalococcoides mccartyi TaxID=61435 RepID=UPI0008056636|nr:ferritin-like domain-containing protein [Dehalococcoides mccartyi]OBW63425.1 MAG: bacterioferritin [Dehalococcoides mccartyi]